MSKMKYITIKEYAAKYGLGGHQAVLYHINKGHIKAKKIKTTFTKVGYYYKVADKDYR